MTPHAYLPEMLIQRMCKYKKYNGQDRDLDIYNSTLKVDRDGKIFVENTDHRGIIGDCLSLFEGDRGVHRDLKVQGVDNKRNQTTPLTRKELAEAISMTERSETTRQNEISSNATDPGIDITSYNLTAQQTLQKKLLGEHYGGCTGSCERWAVSPYWPIVWSALGAAAVFATGKMVWNRCKARHGISYRSFKTPDSEAVAESVV
eukprot:Blabericola_migrator_1__9557@NODE_5204_length_847_cov_3_411538_g3317_i0_p1_GENE_NODE_5204_length_847_cov_3_411538_g3317_i0NODE_5204_length_847_cov_3_411538_g3317_i0_p1_ORF_typecomplete_len234_score35_69stn_TNFRSF12A/PF12191_8/0_17_NODE_5204_length_847_cov_3_411538_g3317_i093704